MCFFCCFTSQLHKEKQKKEKKEKGKKSEKEPELDSEKLKKVCTVRAQLVPQEISRNKGKNQTYCC